MNVRKIFYTYMVNNEKFSKFAGFKKATDFTEARFPEIQQAECPWR